MRLRWLQLMRPALAYFLSAAVVIAILCFGLLGIRAAFSQEMSGCTDSKTALRNLAERFGEHPIGFGLSSKGNLDIVTVNTETGTWTALLMGTNGQACVSAVGTGWQTAAPQQTGEPS